MINAIGPIAARPSPTTPADASKEIYTLAGRTAALQSVLPRCYGMATDAASGEHALFLELLTDVQRLDATGATADWSPEAIDAALRAAAGWHAAFWNIDDARAAWAGPRRTTDDMIADASLWHGLLDDTRYAVSRHCHRVGLATTTSPDRHAARLASDQGQLSNDISP